MEDEYVEVEIDLADIRKKCGPYWVDKMWHQFRYSKENNTMHFNEWLGQVMSQAVAEKVWLDSPKMIVVGTDGSIRIEVLQ